MANSILYLGDTHLHDAAAYLAGLMHGWGWQFDYVPSHEPTPVEMFDSPRALVIISDYPAARMDATDPATVTQTSGRRSTGLIMIGGWESFHGLGGDWDGTLVGDVHCPVIIESDRRSDELRSTGARPPNRRASGRGRDCRGIRDRPSSVASTG